MDCTQTVHKYLYIFHSFEKRISENCSKMSEFSSAEIEDRKEEKKYKKQQL